METNKIIILIVIFTIILLSLGNMIGSFYFINKAINLVEQQAPPLTVSRAEISKIKTLIK